MLEEDRDICMVPLKSRRGVGILAKGSQHMHEPKNRRSIHALRLSAHWPNGLFEQTSC